MQLSSEPLGATVSHVCVKRSSASSVAVGRVCWPSISTSHLFSFLIALWDTQRRKCGSDPACNPRERERDANADRVGQIAARFAPPPPAPLQFVNAFQRTGGFFHPLIYGPPHYEQPHPVAQYPARNDGGAFAWIDNPCVYTRFTMTFTILMQFRSTRYYEPHPPIHP